MAHTQNILAQLKQGEENEEMPNDLRERLRERRKELEEEL